MSTQRLPVGQLVKRAARRACPVCGRSGIFETWFIGVVIATAPDVAWSVILVAGIVMNVLFPIFFYPYSKTLWMALDLSVHPLEEGEHRRP